MREGGFIVHEKKQFGWFKSLIISLICYILIYFYIYNENTLLFSLSLVACVFSIGFFILLNYTGRGSFYYVLSHVIIFICVFTVVSFYFLITGVKYGLKTIDPIVKVIKYIFW